MTAISATLVALALLAAACGGGTGEPASPVAGPTSAPEPTAPAPDPDDDSASRHVVWGDPSVIAELPDDWTIGACLGEAPMLCVSHRAQHMGVIEAVSYPISSLPFIPPDVEVDAALSAIANDLFVGTGEDRAIGCGETYRLTTRPLEQRAVAGRTGASFGFDGALADGSAAESDIHYATIVDGRVIMIVAAAYNPGGCLAPQEGGSLTTKQLEQLEPYISEIVANSELPRSLF